MRAFADWQRGFESSGNLLCGISSLLGLFSPLLNDAAKMCNGMTAPQLLLANVWEGMTRAASGDYGDPDLVDRLLNAERRLPAFSNTDHGSTMALSPTMRFSETAPDGIFGIFDIPTEGISYIGPFDLRSGLAGAAFGQS